MAHAGLQAILALFWGVSLAASVLAIPGAVFVPTLVSLLFRPLPLIAAGLALSLAMLAEASLWLPPVRQGEKLLRITWVLGIGLFVLASVLGPALALGGFAAAVFSGQAPKWYGWRRVLLPALAARLFFSGTALALAAWQLLR